jgi:hypothetical protein
MGNVDVAADIGIWICAHVPGQQYDPKVSIDTIV